MHTIEGLVDVTPRVNVALALDELSYLGNRLARWSIMTTMARRETGFGATEYADEYMKMVLAELEKIEAERQKLLAALKAASMQDVSRETSEVAA